MKKSTKDKKLLKLLRLISCFTVSDKIKLLEERSKSNKQGLKKYHQILQVAKSSCNIYKG